MFILRFFLLQTVDLVDSIVTKECSFTGLDEFKLVVVSPLVGIYVNIAILRSPGTL
ncbi:hypothetical protein SAMN04487852_104189 [Prevotella sp. tf2-5]|nr:hypothetical protein SAMN04487852_104189 [Prevotella sp. tf2-5]